MTTRLSTQRRPAARRDFRRGGFTMLEILVVLAIIGLLVGLAVTNTDKIFGGAQASTARMFVQSSVKAPLTAYRVAMGNLPTTAEGLQALITAPAGKASQWTGPYLDGSKVPLDPWGNPYQYAYPGTRNKDSYDLWSRGPDGQDGTGDDIGNWDKPAAENK